MYRWMDYQSLFSALSLLTDAVAEDDRQKHSDPNGNQSGALPGAVLGRLLELERSPGQAVPGQRTCRCGVNRSRRHGVAWGSCAKERCGARAGLKEEMPSRKIPGERKILRI